LVLLFEKITFYCSSLMPPIHPCARLPETLD